MHDNMWKVHSGTCCVQMVNEWFSTLSVLTNSYVYGQKVELHATMKGTLRSVTQFLSKPKQNYLGLAHTAEQVNKGVEKNLSLPCVKHFSESFSQTSIDTSSRIWNLEGDIRVIWRGWNVWHVYTSGPRGWEYVTIRTGRGGHILQKQL